MSTIPLGIPTGTAQDIVWSESDQALYVSTSTGLILGIDPLTSVVGTAGAVPGANLKRLTTDDSAGTVVWAIDAQTNNLYEVLVGGTFPAGPQGNGVVVDLENSEPPAPSYLVTLLDNSFNFLQAGTVVALYDSNIYMYVGGWGRPGKPTAATVELSAVAVSVNAGNPAGNVPGELAIFSMLNFPTCQCEVRHRPHRV